MWSIVLAFCVEVILTIFGLTSDFYVKSFKTMKYLIIPVESPEYEAAKFLLLDALHAITEMSVCQDCYRHSIIKHNENWFIKPCKPPHELVFAKQTGYSFWPAKVIRRIDNKIDVRFFGGNHSRADIPLRNIRPAHDKPAMKRTSLLDKAMKEFAAHQKALSETLKEPPKATGRKSKGEVAKRKLDRNMENKSPVNSFKKDKFEVNSSSNAALKKSKINRRTMISRSVASASPASVLSDGMSVPPDVLPHFEQYV